MSIAQHMRQAEFYREVLHNEAQRRARSGETRAWLMKNIGEAPEQEVIKRAIECIADLTGDECLRKKVNT